MNVALEEEGYKPIEMEVGMHGEGNTKGGVFAVAALAIVLAFVFCYFSGSMSLQAVSTNVYNLLECKDVGIAYVIDKGDTSPELKPIDDDVIDFIQFLYISLLGDEMTIPASESGTEFGLLALREKDLEMEVYSDTTGGYINVPYAKGHSFKTFQLMGTVHKPTDMSAMSSTETFFYWNISGVMGVSDKLVPVGSVLYNEEYDPDFVPGYAMPNLQDEVACQLIVWNVDRTRTTLDCKDVGYLETQNYLAQGPAELHSGAYIVQACKQGNWLVELPDYVGFMTRENLDKYALDESVVDKILSGFSKLPAYLQSAKEMIPAP